jgi:hypothetical protein
MTRIWKEKPEAHDYPAAADYLTMVLGEADSRKLVAALKKAPTVERKAKDILRASRLPLLARDDPHVADDLKKIKRGKSLSPVLLIRGNAAADVPLLIADGYHRVCASWYRDENIPIACRIVSFPAAKRRM